MTNQPYLRPRLTGQRFETHAIPLELLRDLAVLEEMVVEVAKWRFLKEHPERERSPRGFTKGVGLGLQAVDEGSATAVIALLLGSVLPPPAQVYFEQAREAIISAISAAAENRDPTEHLPEKVLTYFDRFGRGLRDGEAIEFATDVPDVPVRLTKDVRRRLLLASSGVKELTEEVELRASVHEFNQDAMTFQVTLADGSKILAPLGTQHFDNIMTAFNGYKQGVKILLQGVGRFNRFERLQSIESIEHTTLLEPQDVLARIEELKTLRDGWLDGFGVAPSPQGLDWLASALDVYYPDTLPLPYVYPVAEGGVQLEWPIKDNEVSLEIDFSNKSGEWHVLNLTSNAEEMETLDLRDEIGWRRVIGRLREFTGATE